MSILDIIIGLPILYFGYKGAVNGFVKEVLNIVAIILAVFLTINYMDAFGDVIAPLFENNPSYIPFASGVILFLGTLIFVALVAYLAKKFIEAVKLGAINRAFGALFGALKISMLISAILILLAGFNFPAEKVKQESILYSYVFSIGPWVHNSVALFYPGAESYTETIKAIIEKYNPIEKLPEIINND